MDHYEFLIAAERKYAIALAKYEVAEHATETIVGLKALTEADYRIRAERRKLEAEMERIAGTIRRLCDPNWTPGHIAPLHLRKFPRRHGEVSKIAYKVMRKEQRPMGSREIAKQVAAQLGLEAPGHKELLKLDVAVRMAFERRARSGQLVLHPGKPMKWSIKPPGQRASAASANARPTPSTSAGPQP